MQFDNRVTEDNLHTLVCVCVSSIFGAGECSVKFDMKV